VSLGLLSILGVLLTALVTGTAAAAAFSLPFEQGLLIGAVLSPTDPAILIPLFVGSRLRARVAQTLVAESAFNDPTGAVLALAIAGALLSGEGSLTGPAGDFVGQLGLSTVVGVLAGIVLSATISSRRTGVWRDSAAIAVLAVVAVSCVSLDFAGGSGYLGAFLAGLIVGNMELLRLSMHAEHQRELAVASRNLADIVTIFVFVVVGANLPLRRSARSWCPRSRSWRSCRSRGRSPSPPACSPTAEVAGAAVSRVQHTKASSWRGPGGAGRRARRPRRPQRRPARQRGGPGHPRHAQSSRRSRPRGWHGA
jgi:cell volume regulation protein A